MSEPRDEDVDETTDDKIVDETSADTEVDEVSVKVVAENPAEADVGEPAVDLASEETAADEAVEDAPVVSADEVVAVIEDAPIVAVAADVLIPEGRYHAVPVIPDPPSYAPIITGLGITLIAWGFLTNYVILLFGFTIFSLAISIWIKELTR